MEWYGRAALIFTLLVFAAVWMSISQAWRDPSPVRAPDHTGASVVMLRPVAAAPAERGGTQGDAEGSSQ